MKQNVYNQPYNHHHHHQSNNTTSSNNSNPPANPPNYSSALKNNNNNSNNTSSSSSSSGGPRGGSPHQNKAQHTGYNNNRSGNSNQNSHGPSMNYTGYQQQSGTNAAAGGPPPGHGYENQHFNNYNQQAQSYGGAKQPGSGQQFNQQGYNKSAAPPAENGPFYNKGPQHKQVHVTAPPNLVQQHHAQPPVTSTTAAVVVVEPTPPVITKQASVEEAKVVTPVAPVADIVEKMSSMQIEQSKPVVEEKTSDETSPTESLTTDGPAVIISGDQIDEPTRLCDVTGLGENGADNSEYYRNLVVAVDRLYPESKFPLHDTWTFGYIKNDPSATRWEMNIKEIIDIAYVEDFWSVVTNCPTASQLSNLGDLTFFKKGIRPMWEDAENKQGGSWLHQVSGNAGAGSFANKRPFAMDVDEFWIETLMALIGDNFCANNHLVTGDSSSTSPDTHICGNISGLFLSHRGKGWKLALWTKNYRDEKTTRLIGKMWKHLLKLNDNHTITFEAHESKHNKNASNKIVYKE